MSFVSQKYDFFDGETATLFTFTPESHEPQHTPHPDRKGASDGYPF